MKEENIMNKQEIRKTVREEFSKMIKEGTWELSERAARGFREALRT